MRPCRRQDSRPCRQAAGSAGASPAASSTRSSGGEPAVRRYIHPIQTARPGRRNSTEELLSQILDSLTRQSALLEELLRRGGSNSTDTN